MKIAMAQMKISKNQSENLEKSLKMIETAASEGAKLICFPELQLSPFFPQYAGLDVSAHVLSIEDERILKMREKCKECGIMAVPNI